MERTLIIAKPDALQRGLVGEIISRLERKGLKLIGIKMEALDETRLRIHYAEHVEKGFYSGLEEFMKSSPVVLMAWEGYECVESVRSIVGATNPRQATPGSIRGDLAIGTGRNLIHASDSKESGESEIAHFFSESELHDYKKNQTVSESNKPVKYFADQFDDEEVLFVFHKHPLVMRRGLILGLLGPLVGVLPALHFLSISSFIIGLIAGSVLGGIVFLPSWVGWHFSVFIVTDQRFMQITQKGFFHRSVADLALSQIQSVNYEIAGLQETMLGFGTIKMQTYVGDLIIHDVHKPARVQKEILTILRDKGVAATTKAGPSWVSYESYLFELRRNMHYYATQQQATFKGKDGTAQLTRLKQEAMDQVIQDAYVKELAKENNVSVSDQAVNSEIATLTNENRLGSSQQSLESTLSSYFGWNISDLKQKIKQELLDQAVVAKLDTATNLKAQSALQQLSKGADFGTLASQLSDDLSTKSNGGQYPSAITLNSTNVPPAIAAEAYKLKVGQTSGIINTGLTLDIIKVINTGSDGVHIAHIQFTFQPITTYVSQYQAKHPPHTYIHV
ncbi:unnamed protein product [Sphagnum balticum]